MLSNSGMGGQSKVMPNLKKPQQMYADIDDDMPADESKSKIHMQQMANTGYDGGFNGP